MSRAIGIALLSAGVQAGGVNTLEGRAMLPASTRSDGPPTGQLGGTGFSINSGLRPLINALSAQGLSAVLNGPVAGS